MRTTLAVCRGCHRQLLRCWPISSLESSSVQKGSSLLILARLLRCCGSQQVQATATMTTTMKCSRKSIREKTMTTATMITMRIESTASSALRPVCL